MTTSYQRLGSHRLVHLFVAGRGPGSAADQARTALISAADTLADHGLGLEHVVRTRLWAREGVSRGAASPARPEILSGPARSASSSYVGPDRLPDSVLVAFDVVARRPGPGETPVKTVVEHDPPQNPIRYLAVQDLVVLTGTTSLAPTLPEQVAQIVTSIVTDLRDAGTGPGGIVELRCYLHRGEDPEVLHDELDRLLPGATAYDVELVDGFSTPGKRVELEVTALRPEAP